jgi:hypothetical protein
MRREEEMAEKPPFDLLPVSALQRQAPRGYRVCRREPLPGKTLQETDELVRSAGGWREGESPSRISIRRVPADDWYVLPESAFAEGQRPPSRRRRWILGE